MIDPVSLAIAIAGVIAAVVALYEITLDRRQIKLQEDDLRLQKEALEATVGQLKADEAKIESLQSIVKALSELTAYQAKQIATLERANSIAADALEVAKSTQALAAEKLAWEKMNPIDKAVEAGREILDRGVENLKAGWRKLTGGR